MVKGIKSLVDETEMLAKAGQNGQLDTRGDASKFKGAYKELVEGFNGTLDNVIGPLNVAAEYVDRISKGDIPPKITDEYNGDFNEIKNNLNTCIDAVNALVSDAGMLAKAAVAGQLDTRADASKHGGDFREIVEGVNATLDNVIGPLNVAAEYVDRISKGDIPPKITDEYNGDFNEIKNNLNVCIDSLNSLIEEMNKMSREHDAGDIDVKVDESIFQGAYQEMASGVNEMVFGHIAVKKKAMACFKEFGEGNLDAEIEQFPGKKKFINETIEEVRTNIKALISDAGMLAQAAAEGKLDTRADASKHKGDFRKIVDGVNATLDNVIGPLNVAAEYVDRISKGDIPPKITDEYNGDFNEIKNNLNTCIDTLNSLIDSMVETTDEQRKGDIDAFADETKFAGAYQKLITGFNDGMKIHINAILQILDLLQEYSEGDLSSEMPELPGKQIVATERINLLRKNVQNLIEDVDFLVDAATKEEFDTKADPEKHSGDFRKIIEGINKTLELVSSKLFIYENSFDSLPFPVSITDMDMNWIFFNKAVTEITGLKRKEMIGKQCCNWNADICETDECGIEMLRSGNPTSFFKQPGMDKDFKVDTSYIENDEGKRFGHIEVIQDITATNRKAEYNKAEIERLGKNLQSIANGDLELDVEITEADQYTENEYNNFVSIYENLAVVEGAIRALIEDASKLANAAVEGQLDTRADASKHSGEYRNIIEGVNKTLDNVIGPLNVAAEYVDRISKGDIPPKIEDEYRGDFNEIKNNLNTCIDSLNSLIEEMNKMSREHDAGDIDVKVDESIFEGAYKEMAAGVNEMVFGHIQVKKDAMNIANEYGKGNFDAVMPPLPGKKKFINDILDALRQNLLNFNEELGRLIKSTKEGKLDIRGNANNFEGDWAELVTGVNDLVDAFVGPINITAEYVDRISKGDLPPKIEDEYKGDFNEIKNNLNTCIDAVQMLVDDSVTLAKAAVDGKLDTRADAAKHMGDFAEIINGVNDTLDSLIEPVNEAGKVLSIMASGDLTRKMTGEYKGDNEQLKQYINSVLNSLTDLISQVSDAVQQTASAAVQISSTADAMAASSEEQSAQADEVASAVEEMSRTITENAMAASKTAEEAEKNKEVATEGGNVVEQTVGKMRDIATVVKQSADNIEKLGESSKQIGEIISVIDDIADQTNLLALNAAIEAARAGEQGRGFAVVADEVRKLAERTTEATKQIATMIKGIQNETQQAVEAMKKGNDEVSSGIELADRAGTSLEQIVSSSQEVQDMINQIAAASEQQSSTSEEIAKNVASISEVSRESAKRVQDIASSSDDMAKLTEHLRDLMNQFKIRGGGDQDYDMDEEPVKISSKANKSLPPGESE